MKRYYKPQLAKGGGLRDAKKYLENPRYVAQEKKDGVRILFHKDLSGRCSIYTRTVSAETGKPIRHTKKLYHIIADLRNKVPNGTVIDGELTSPRGKTASDVMKVLGTKTIGYWNGSDYKQRHVTGYLEFHMFDLICWGGFNLAQMEYTYENRHTLLLGIKGTTYAKLLPITHCATAEDKKKLYEQVVSGGGEGLVLKDLDGVYREGVRHDALVKLKEKVTWDVVMVGITMAKETSIKKGESVPTPTRIVGQVGDIRYGMYRAGKLEYLGRVSNFSDEVRSDLNANWQKYVADKRVLEVEGQLMFKSGAIRHATFKGWRDDKLASECILSGTEQVDEPGSQADVLDNSNAQADAMA